MWCVVKTFLSPLKPEEEKLCIEKMKKGDTGAKQELILHNMRLVAHVVKRYAGIEEDAEELISIETIGLLKAVDSFDHEFGNKFSTYAIRCIDNEILMHFRRVKKRKGDVSLYEPIGVDKEGNQIQLFDILENQEKDISLISEEKSEIDVIRRNYKKLLNERECEIIQRRFGLEGRMEQTQREIAESLNISRSYVSRIEKKALEKLKNLLEK